MHHFPHRRLRLFQGFALLAIAALVSVTVPGLAVRAQDPPPAPAAEEPEEPPGLVGASATTADLAWLTGNWAGHGLGGEIEETWSRPAGGSLMGMFRLVVNEKTVLYEFLLLEDSPRGVRLYFKHYGPGHRAWEKDAPLSFLLVQSAPGRAEFLSEDLRQSPLRMVYAQQGSEQGQLLSVVVENPEHLPEPRSFEVVFRRVDSAPR